MSFFSWPISSSWLLSVSGMALLSRIFRAIMMWAWLARSLMSVFQRICFSLSSMLSFWRVGGGVLFVVGVCGGFLLVPAVFVPGSDGLVCAGGWLCAYDAASGVDDYVGVGIHNFRRWKRVIVF